MEETSLQDSEIKTGITDLLEKKASKTFSESSKETVGQTEKTESAEIVENILRRNHHHLFELAD